jgi:hypothetical protein
MLRWVVSSDANAAKQAAAKIENADSQATIDV